MTARLATAGDIPAILQLAQASYADQLAEFGGRADLFKSVSLADVQRWIANGYRVAVDETASGIIGAAMGLYEGGELHLLRGMISPALSPLQALNSFRRLILFAAGAVPPATIIWGIVPAGSRAAQFFASRGVTLRQESREDNLLRYEWTAAQTLAGL